MTNEIPYSNDSLTGGPGNALVPYSSTVAMTARSAELVALGGAWGTSLDGLVWESAYDAKGTTPEWRQAFFTLLALHPDVRVRRHLAVTGPLGTLRRLVHDPNPAVRYAAACNPRVVDVEVQRALAGDSDVRVVLQLLARVTPDREAALIVANGQHPEAKRVLAGMRIGLDLLTLLSQSDDLVTRAIARGRLRAVGVRRGILELEPAGRTSAGTSLTIDSLDREALYSKVEVLVEQRRPLSSFQARLYKERAGLDPDEAQQWWDLHIHSAEAAAAIAAGRTPAEEAERRRVADRDRWILNGMAEQGGLPELLGCVA